MSDEMKPTQWRGLDNPAALRGLLENAWSLNKNLKRQCDEKQQEIKNLRETIDVMKTRIGVLESRNAGAHRLIAELRDPTGLIRRAAEQYAFDYTDKRCSGCYAAVEPNDGTWRWTGEHWEHRCEGLHPQAGHIVAEVVR